VTKPSQDNIFKIDEKILSQTPLEEKVYLARMDKEDIDVLQAVFDLVII
jgi:hypothetical protein